MTGPRSANGRAKPATGPSRALGGKIAKDSGWSYPEPSAAFIALRDHIAVYAAAMDACYVADEKATPQPGGFYGGWVTANLIGPFKGSPGTAFW